MGTALFVKFLQSNWKAIVLAILVAGAVYWFDTQLDEAYARGSREGVAAQLKVDADAIAKLQKEHDAKVDALEKTVRDFGNKLYEEQELARKKKIEVDKLLASKLKVLNQFMYGPDGKPLTCLPAGADVHLGTEFSTLWNTYNKEVR